ncbi:MAG: hypothetical protein GTN46_08720 [Gammaproteobacteria bacterium]|nr:hypothetical protein [Gammaproteobacteria bacterium]
MGKQPKIIKTSFGKITVGKNTYEKDIYIFANGDIKKRKKSLAKEVYGTSHKIGPTELKKLCKGHPRTIFIGTGQSGLVELTDEGQNYLAERDIEVKALTTPELISAFNKCEKQKAALIHITC